MKKMTFKKIKRKSGETLVESVVSILLLAIMVLIVSSTTNLAIQLTSRSLEMDTTQQDAANRLVLREAGFASNAQLRLRTNAATLSVSVDLPVMVTEEEGFLSIVPPEEVT